MTRPKATWTLWLKISSFNGTQDWQPLCGAIPGYYFSAKEVLQTIVDKWKRPEGLYRILPAGRVPR